MFAGRTNASDGPHVARGPRAWDPWFRSNFNILFDQNKIRINFQLFFSKTNYSSTFCFGKHVLLGLNDVINWANGCPSRDLEIHHRLLIHVISDNSILITWSSTRTLFHTHSLSLSHSLSFFLSLPLSFFLSLSLSFFLFLSLSLSLSLSLFLSLFLSLSLSLSLTHANTHTNTHTLTHTRISRHELTKINFFQTVN